MTNQSPEKTMAELLPEIAAAKASHEELVREASRARSAETQSFNRLNDLFKRYREAEAALRESMPRQTYWRDPSHSKGYSV